jgi:hypothetical protein
MSPDEYLAQSRDRQAVSTKQVAFSLTQDNSTTPDQHASDIKMAQSLALPTSLTSQFRDTFAQRIEQKRNETILSANPRLQNWMETPDNAKVAKDDLPALSWWEQFSRGAVPATVTETAKGVPVGAVQMGGLALEGAGQVLATGEGADKSPIAKRIAEARSRSPEEIAQLRKDIFQQGVINPSIAQSVLSDVLSGDMRPDEAFSAFEPALEDISRGLQSAGEATQTYSEGMLPAAKGYEDSWARTIGSGIGSMIPIIIAGLASGGGGAAALGAASGAGEASSNARTAGQDEDTQTIAAFMGLLPGATDAIPVERLLNNKVIKAGLASVLRRIGAQAAVEGGQEGVQQVMQNAISQYLYAPDKSLTDDVGENVAAGGVIGAIMEAGKLAFEAALPGRVRGGHIKAKQAEQTKATIDQIGEAANTSKLRQRLDGSFMDFVEKATEGTPIQDIYVPAEKMQELFQSYRYDPEEFLTDLPGVDPTEWQTAITTGGDVKIPTATYAAKLAGSEFDDFLRQNMRFEPDGMTFLEAQDFNARASEIQMQAFEESEAARVAQESERSLDAQEYDELVGRLRAAGRATDVARFEAAPLIAMRRTMASRAGLSQEEFAKANPLPEVRGAVPEGMQAKNVDELTRQLAEMRSFKPKPVENGPSLLEAISDYGGINDTGGELKARDASVVKRGKGKKNLRLARGGVIAGMKDLLGGTEGGKKHGIDDVAQAMIEAGYLQDNPIANEYRNALETGGELPNIGNALLDAIDEELRGNVQYSGNVEADEKGALIDSNIAYLDSLGVSLNDSDDVIREALRKSQEEEGRKYGQPAYHGSPHVFEKFSLDHIGSGEGAQAFGHGLYFAENRGIAEGYRKTLSADRSEVFSDGVKLEVEDPEIANTLQANLQGNKGNVAKTRKSIASHIKMLEANYNRYAKLVANLRAGRNRKDYPWHVTSDLEAGKTMDEIADSLEVSLLGDTPDIIRMYQGALDIIDAHPKLELRKSKGRLFTVDLPENNELLIFDKKLINQHPDVLAALKQVGLEFATTTVEESEFDPNGLFGLVAAGDRATLQSMTGSHFYALIRNRLNDSQEAASKYLRESGIAGHKFLDANSRDDEVSDADRKYNFVIYDDSKINVIRYDQTKDGRRGSIQLPFGGASDSPVIISLFESADLSTFTHESAHYFLNTLQDMQTVSPEIAAMYDSVKTWWRDNANAVAAEAKAVSGLDVTGEHVTAAIDSGTSGDAAIDAAIDTGMHEQFARGFEAYLMEGKAPSIELRAAFERFTQWLIRLYKNLRGLNVDVSPEMKGVYDRLLATDAEIEAARSDISDEMLFAAAEAAGVSPDDYRELVKLHDRSVDAANQRLRKSVMAPIQRETEKWYREEKAKVREEMTDQVNRMPVYRAWEWLGNRRWMGEEAPEGMPDMRLDRDDLVRRYGEGVLKTLPRGKFTVYANEGGMNVDEVAGWFGFESGDALVRGLEQAQPRKEAIEAETERVMRERHGDVLRDGQIEEQAIEAVHNDARGQFLAAELKILKARAGDTSPDMTVSQAREAARQTINRMQVRDAIASNRFLTAERKAANEAVKLARLVERENLWSRQKRRDVQAAVKSGSLRSANSATDKANVSTDRFNDAVSLLVEQKRRQLLNHMLYAESLKATEEIERAERYTSRLSKRSTRSNLAGDYLEAIDELLERYDFRKLSLKSEQRRGSLLAYVQRMTDEGRENELSIPDAVLQDAQRKPYKQLTVDQLRGIVDALRNIEHTARLKQKLKDAKRERDLEAVVGDIVTEFDENVKGTAPSRAKSGRGGAKEGFRSYLNLVKTADTILREIDGFEDGAAYRHIKAPIDEAVSELMVKRRQAGEDFDQLYSLYSKEERRGMTTLQSIPELNGQFSKWDLISIALNVGNEGNYQRLTDNRVKGFFTPQQVELAIGRLDERDWKFVQSAWDLVEGYWPEIEAREKRVTGVAPEKVTPREVKTAFGNLKGGYYPLKYDTEISSLARDDDLNDMAKSMTGGRFGKAQTKNGHTKERAQSSGRPVMIDIGVLHGHINQVVHDLALSEVVTNSWRILQDNDVKSAFLDRGMKSDFDALEVWLQDVASGEVRGADFMNRWSRKLKSGFTVSKLAFNLTTVLLQPTGIAQSIVVVGKKNMLLGVQDMFRRPLSGPNSAASEIIRKSPFMQERETTFNKDIYDLLGEVRAGPTQNRVSAFTSEYLAPWGFWLMQKAQFYTVDMPTWLAGYRQALDQGKSEKDAIAHADRIVARAAASGNFSDRTPIERGTLSRNVRQNDVVRLFTALGSYMFAKFNVAYEQTRQTQFTDPRQVLSWTTDMVMLFTVEAVLAAMVRGQLPWVTTTTTTRTAGPNSLQSRLQ